MDPNQWEELDFVQAFKEHGSGEVTRLCEVNNQGRYDGDGAAIVKDGNGMYWSADYSHCSCYGPGESMNVNGPFTSYEDARRAVGSYRMAELPATEPHV